MKAKSLLVALLTVVLIVSVASQVEMMPLTPLYGSVDENFLHAYSDAMQQMWVSGYVYGVAAAARSGLDAIDLASVSTHLNRGYNGLLLMQLRIAQSDPSSPWYVKPLKEIQDGRY